MRHHVRGPNASVAELREGSLVLVTRDVGLWQHHQLSRPLSSARYKTIQYSLTTENRGVLTAFGNSQGACFVFLCTFESQGVYILYQGYLQKVLMFLDSKLDISRKGRHNLRWWCIRDQAWDKHQTPDTSRCISIVRRGNCVKCVFRLGSIIAETMALPLVLSFSQRFKNRKHMTNWARRILGRLFILLF